MIGTIALSLEVADVRYHYPNSAQELSLGSKQKIVHAVANPTSLDALSAKLREREKRQAALMDRVRAIARKGASSGWRDLIKRLGTDDEYKSADLASGSRYG